jgi:mRNA interferase RelE/StbE
MTSLIGFAFSDDALDFLATLEPKLRRQVTRKAKALINDAHPPGSKKLQGMETADGEAIYRVRSGDYRILYTAREEPAEVVVIEIGHRKDIYR